MRVKLEKLLFRQTAMSQTTAIRSLVHRALAEMETWRRGPGLSQEGDVMAYTESWQAHMNAVSGINESLLAFARGVAAAAASFHASAAAASVHLAPITSGEALLAANADGGAAASAAAAAAGAPGGTSSGSASGGHALTSHASFFGGSATAAGASSGGSSTADGAAADGAVSDAHSVGGAGAAARHALSLSVLTSAIADVLAQAGAQCAEFATTASTDVAGDPDGPLGRKHDGKHLSATALAEKDKAFRAGPSCAMCHASCLALLSTPDLITGPLLLEQAPLRCAASAKTGSY